MSRRTTVTITDVAREAGVALGSVSNAFNHPDKVRPETLKRIREAADRLGYAPNQSARMLAGGRNRLFGLILPNLDHGVSLQIANGANAEARKHGYGLLIATAQTDEDVAHRYRDYFIGTQTAGILMQPPASTDWQPPCTRLASPSHSSISSVTSQVTLSLRTTSPSANSSRATPSRAEPDASQSLANPR